MRLRMAAPLILGSTFLVALIAVACVDNFDSVVQTTTSEQKAANRTATAVVLISLGIDPDDVAVVVGKGSLAEKVQQTQEAERQERLEAGGGETEAALVELPNGEFVTAAQATQIAEFGTEDQPINPPDGPAQSGPVTVNIITTGKMVPSVLKITPGTTVTWLNTERTGHSSKSDPGQADEWDSLDLSRRILDKENRSFSYTFNILGRFTYGSRVGGDSSLAVVFVVEE